MDSWDRDPRKQNVGSATTKKDLSCKVQIGMENEVSLHQSVAHLWQIPQWERAWVDEA